MLYVLEIKRRNVATGGTVEVNVRLQFNVTGEL